MRTLILLSLICSGVCFAGNEVHLSPAEARDKGFQFVSIAGSTPTEVEELNRNALCTPVEFSLPLQISKEHPEWTQVLVVGEVYLSDKVLTTTATYSLEINGRNVAHGCFPLSAGYKIDLRLSYNPPEIRKMPLCPPTFVLEDFKKFVDFGISE